MPVVSATQESIERAASLICGGGVVAFPTETVYGLGADAFNARAVARIFEIKNRPTFDPLIVHVANDEMLARVASHVSDLARRLATRFWPGPLTLVMPKSELVPELVTAGLPTVAVRMPAHPVARALLMRSERPIAAPSANPFGYLSPTCAIHVERMLGNRVDLILDGGSCEHGIESTILLLEPVPTLLRHGAISVEELEAAIGPIERNIHDETAPLAPGRLEHHYAPHTPIRLIDPFSVVLEQRRGAAALTFERATDGYAVSRVLSPGGDLREAAARFFGCLHELDRAGVVRIDAEPISEHGLGAAIMDRLRRAAAGVDLRRLGSDSTI